MSGFKVMDNLYYQYTSLVDFQTMDQPCALDALVPKNSNQEKPMRCYDDECEGQTDPKVDYLANRVSNIYYTKSDELQKTFGLVNDDPPATPKEIIDRLASGKFVVNEDRMNERHYNPLAFFQWRDPAVKKDTDGFNKAIETMGKARTEALDTINVISDETAKLKALKDFESKTFH